MGALAKDRTTAYREGVEVEFPVAAATKIYAGSLVMISATGYAIPGADTADCKFGGVALEQIDNSAGADGAQVVRLRRTGVFDFAAASITQAMVGGIMELVDDQTFDDAAGPANHIKCGQLVKYVGANRGWIDIGRRTA